MEQRKRHPFGNFFPQRCDEFKQHYYFFLLKLVGLKYVTYWRTHLPPFFLLTVSSLFFSNWTFLISLTSSWKHSSMWTRSLADVSKKGHLRVLASISPSPFETSLLSAMSDWREREREGGGKVIENEREISPGYLVPYKNNGDMLLCVLDSLDLLTDLRHGQERVPLNERVD